METKSPNSSVFKRFRSFLILSISAILLLSFTYTEDLFQISKNLDIFAAVYKQLSINYVDEVIPSKVMKYGIDAMLEELDPYTEYIPESEIENYKLKYVSTHYGGIGATMTNRDGRIIVAQPFEGFPAQKAGIKAGDEIVEINGIKVFGKNNEDVSSILKGSKGSSVRLTLKRSISNRVESLTLIREEITQDNVPYYGMMEQQVGYIKLDKFLENSASEVEDALLDLKKSNSLKGLVIDLRQNGGGILQEAVKIVNLFVTKGQTVVIQKGKNREKSITYTTLKNPIEAELPLVILVDGRSASASEIVAGSLQDLDRAVVIGQRSFGKGLVQQTFNLPYNSLVKVTVAKYFTPSGRCIQALDYGNRDLEGSVIKIPDSLITEYKTRNGRSVYDGSGIYPDLFIKPHRYHAITLTLLSKSLIFDFATEFRSKNSEISNSRSFKLSESDYAKFISFLSNKDYQYKTRTESLLNNFHLEAARENKLVDIQLEYDALKEKISHSKKNDLVEFKDEIIKVLESEIVSRYTYERGRLEQSFQYDKELAESLKVIANKRVIASILSGEGNYNSIGRPGTEFSASIGN